MDLETLFLGLFDLLVVGQRGLAFFQTCNVHFLLISHFSIFTYFAWRIWARLQTAVICYMSDRLRLCMAVFFVRRLIFYPA